MPVPKIAAPPWVKARGGTDSHTRYTERVQLTCSGTSTEDASATAEALYAAYAGTLFAWAALGPPDPSMDPLENTFATICTCKE